MTTPTTFLGNSLAKRHRWSRRVVEDYVSFVTRTYPFEAARIPEEISVCNPLLDRSIDIFIP